MHPETRLTRLMHVLSPTGWLIVILGSMIVATGAALILLARVDGPQRHVPGQLFDAVELFLRDTVRLTFKDRADGNASDSVFIAPKGILQKDATFVWVENSEVIESRRADILPPSAAPARLLDSDWTPAFSGLPRNQKNP
jgi:hypothetical protein